MQIIPEQFREADTRPPLHTAMLSIGDARNPRSWSGIPFHITRALEQQLGPVSFLGPMPDWPGRLHRAGLRLKGKTDERRRTLPGQSDQLARYYARVAGQRLARLSTRPDLIFSPVGSALVAYLETDLPVVYSSDATARLMFDYYPRYTGLSDVTRAMADELERRSIARADLLLYPTDWAAASAVEDYGADPGKIRVIPYGANFSATPEAPPMPDEGGPCRLLMVGVNWEIKGGAIAVEALAGLQARGIKAELTVVGCAPPEPTQRPGLTFIPFLDKNSADDRQRLADLYRQASFFILPSRCECFGIVFCEAAALGLPAIASRTGGIPEAVREGENGHTLPLDASGDVWAEKIAHAWADPEGYRALRRRSRNAFETRLNWDTWCIAAKTEIRDMLATYRKV